MGLLVWRNDEEGGYVEPEYRLWWLHGNCPVQGDGFCCGHHPFYFRGRHRTLSVRIGLEEQPAWGQKELDGWITRADRDDLWLYRETIGPDEERFASWITAPHVNMLLQWAVLKFWSDTMVWTRHGQEEGTT